MASEEAYRDEIPLEWLPTIPRRYLATFIDGLIILLFYVVPSSIWTANTEPARLARIIIALAALLLYEPICTGCFVTVGQYLMKVRVRRFDNGRQIGNARAYARIFVKVMLGLISLLTIAVTHGRRAIHDLGSGSIVILAEAEPEFARWATGEPNPQEAPDNKARQ